MEVNQSVVLCFTSSLCFILQRILLVVSFNFLVTHSLFDNILV